VLLPFLAHFAPSNLVPYSPNVSICSFTPCFSRSPLVHPFDVLLQVIFTDIVYPSSRHLFTVKSIVTPIAGITFFIWCIVKAKGVGPIIHQPSTLHGSDLGWGMVVSLMSCISNMATLVTYVLVFIFFWSRDVRLLIPHLPPTYSNAPDFASRAANPAAALWPQLISVPISFSLVSFIGIIVSSSSQTIFGEAIWSPIDLLGRFLDDSPSHATRFGVWFISFAFIIAQLGTNISANSISAGCDLTALFPRFIVSF